MRSPILLCLSALTATGIARGQGLCRIDSLSPLPSISSPRLLAGLYDLVWHPVRSRLQRPRRERLWLWLTSPLDSSLDPHPFKPATDDTIIYPLFGRLAAWETSPLAVDSFRRITDPIAPPVILRVGWPPDATHEVWLDLELLIGAKVNRIPNHLMYDIGGVGVQLTRLGTAGFEGSYRTFGFGAVDSGYLCARRVR